MAAFHDVLTVGFNDCWEFFTVCGDHGWIQQISLGATDIFGCVEQDVI